MPLASRIIRPDHFDMVIVDEFHHAAAPSLRRTARTNHSRGSFSVSPPHQSAPTGLTFCSISTVGSQPSYGCGTRSISNIWCRSTTSASMTGSIFEMSLGDEAGLRH